MKRNRWISLIFINLVIWGCNSQPAFEIVEEKDQIKIMAGKDHFTTYLHSDDIIKPVLYPVYSPSQIRMQRQYPLKTVEGESHDHEHHVGLFFTYGADGEVNGSSFWDRHDPPPRITHKEVTQKEVSSNSATLGTIADWVGKDGEVIMEEHRTMVFTEKESERAIDFTFNLKAMDQDVDFGTTKEGMFAIRVADWLNEKNEEKGTATYLNAHGETTEENVWGKRSKWMRLEGEHNGTTVGIAILNHPSSVNYPTYWHARSYGLFSANPLGQYFFEKARDVENPEPLNFSIPAGESAVFKFKMIIYEGHRTQEDIEQAFEEYTS